MCCEDGLHSKIIYFFLAGHLAACKEVELLGGRPALAVAPLAVDVESLKNKLLPLLPLLPPLLCLLEVILGSTWGQLGATNVQQVAVTQVTVTLVAWV